MTSPPRILVVEDLEHSRELFKTILEREGYAVDLVGDGRAAVDAVERRRYDLILIDIQMPVLDGLEATRLIRRSGEGGEAATIIGMSANTSPDQLRAFEAAGMDDHLRKPFRRAQLLDKIGLWLAVAPPATSASPPVEAEPGFQDLVALFGSEWVRTGLTVLCRQIDDLLAQPPDAEPRVLGRLAHGMISQSALLGFRSLCERVGDLQDACQAGRCVGEALARSKDEAATARQEAARLLAGMS